MKKFFGKFSKPKKQKGASSAHSSSLSIASSNSRGSISKSQNDISEYPGYFVKEKDLDKIHKAVWNGDIDKVQSLVKKGPNILDKEKRTPLHLACVQGHHEIVLELLAYNAKVNLIDKEGRTAAMKAAEMGHAECLKALIESNAELDRKDSSGNAAIHLAANSGFVNVVEALIEAKVKPNQPNEEGFTALHLAVENDDLAMAEFLLNNGAEVDFPMPDRSTSLMLACTKGCEDMVKLILDNHPDTILKNDNGYDAIECANMTQHENCSELIAEYQVSHGIKSARGPNLPKVTVTGISSSSLAIDDTDDILEAIANDIKPFSSADQNISDSKDEDADPNSWQSDTETAQPVKKAINHAKLKTFLGKENSQSDEPVAGKPPPCTTFMKEKFKPEVADVTPRSDILNESMNSSGKKDGDSSIVQPPPGFDRQESDWDSTEESPQKNSTNVKKQNGLLKHQDSDWDSSIAEDIPQLPELSVDDILEDGLELQPPVTMSHLMKSKPTNQANIESDWDSSIMANTPRNEISGQLKKQVAAAEESDWDISTVANTPRVPNKNDIESDWDSSIGGEQASKTKDPSAKVKQEESDWDSTSSVAVTPRTPKGFLAGAHTPQIKELDEEDVEDVKQKSKGFSKQESDWDSSSMVSDNDHEEKLSDDSSDHLDDPLLQNQSNLLSNKVESLRDTNDQSSLSAIKEVSSSLKQNENSRCRHQPPQFETDKNVSNQADNEKEEVEVDVDEDVGTSDSTLSESVPALPDDDAEKELSEQMLHQTDSKRPSLVSSTGAASLGPRIEPTGEETIAHGNVVHVEEVVDEKGESRSSSDSEFGTGMITIKRVESMGSTIVSSFRQESVSKPIGSNPKDSGSESDTDVEIVKNDQSKIPATPTLKTGEPTQLSTSGFASKSTNQNDGRRQPIRSSNSVGYDSDSSLTDFESTPFGREANELTTPLGSYIHGVLGGPNHPDIVNTNIMEQVQAEANANQSHDRSHIAGGGDALDYSSTDQEESRSGQKPGRMPFLKGNTSINDTGGIDAGNVINRLQTQLKENQRQLENEKKNYKSLEYTKKQLEAKNNELKRQLEESKVAYRELQFSKVEAEEKFNDKAYAFNEDEDKRRNLEMLLTKTKQQLQKKEDELFNEQQSRQRADLDLRNVQMELKSLEINKKRLTSERDDLLKALEYERSARKQDDAKLAEDQLMIETLTQKLNSNAGKYQNESNLQQNPTFQQEALELANAKITELRAQVEDLQNQLKQTQDALNDPKNKMPKIDWAEWNHKLQSKEREMVKLRDSNRSLSEKLTETENRISSISTELENSSRTLEDKLNQIKTLRDELEHHITENSELKEKHQSLENESEKLTSRNETLSERMTDLLDNNTVIFHHLDTLLQGAADREKLNQADIERIGDIMDIITRQKSIEKSTRNSDASLNLMISTSFLQNQTVVELEQSQKKCDQLQEKLKQIQHQHSTSIKKLTELETDLQNANLSKSGYESECLKLRDQLEMARSLGRHSAEGRTASHDDHLSAMHSDFHSPPDTVYERSYGKSTTAPVQEAWVKSSGLPERDEFIRTFQNVTENSLSNSPRYRTLERQLASTELEDEIQRTEMASTLDVHKQTLDSGAKSIKQLNRKIAQLEREKQQLTRKLELERSGLKKSEDRRHTLEEKLEEENRKYMDLESEYKNLQSLHKAAQKKVKELTKARIDSRHIDENIGSLRKHLESLRREIELSTLQADCNAEQQEQNAKYLATINSMEKTLEEIADQKKKLQQEYDSFRKYAEGNMIERSELSRIRSELEEKTRGEISDQVNRVTRYLEEVDKQRQSLDKARDDTEDRLRTDLDRTRRDMRDELERLRKTCDELMQDKERLKSENKRLEKMLNQETPQRSIIPERLSDSADFNTFDSKLGQNTINNLQNYDTFGNRDFDQHVHHLSSMSLARATGDHQIASSGFAHYVGGSFSAIPSLYKTGKLSSVRDRFGGSHSSVNHTSSKVTSEFLHQKLKAELDRSIAKHLEADKSNRTKGSSSNAAHPPTNGDGDAICDSLPDMEDVDLSFITFLRKKYFIS